jgi:murein DD-endopeptidase MepM/ murein hydrolase activator NlpD
MPLFVRLLAAYFALPLVVGIPLVLIVLFSTPAPQGCVPLHEGGRVSDARIPAEYAGLVNDAATTHGVSAPWLAAMLQAESAWNPRAVSSAGAQGLGQLMPGTARRLGVTDPFDPAQNIDGAARYLKQQYEHFGSWELALAAYNAGPGAVIRYGGIPPYAETRAYVPRVAALAEQYGAEDAAVIVCAEGVAAAAEGPVIVDETACPIGRPHHFTDTWGAPRSGGRTHKGVDMFAEVGVPLYAYRSGTVRLTSSRLGGISLWITADSGDRYYYAHLSGYAEGLTSGARVEVGDVVGYNGNTGNARYTPPHLHWEVHPGGGSAVNPTPYARAACASE